MDKEQTIKGDKLKEALQPAEERQAAAEEVKVRAITRRIKRVFQ